MSSVGSGGKGTIINALRGGDVKYGIYLHKLLFEDHHLLETDNSISEKFDKLRPLI